MIRTIDGLRFCQCCLFAAVNGDACDCLTHTRECLPHLQTFGKCREGEACTPHAAAVDRGLDRLTADGGHIAPAFDSDTGRGIDEFSWSACDCCRSPLGGSRHEFAILMSVHGCEPPPAEAPRETCEACEGDGQSFDASGNLDGGECGACGGNGDVPAGGNDPTYDESGDRGVERCSE